MKSFQFRLAGALRLRETQARIEETKLTQLLAEEQKIKNFLVSLQQERQNELGRLHGAKEVAALELRSLSSFLVGMESRTLDLQNALAKQSRIVQEQRIRVLRAQRNVRLLIKLREKKLREWTAEAEREIENIAQDAWLSSHRAIRMPRGNADSDSESEA
jgi:flagellar biosynthesis chaperone FliJ